MELLVQLLVTLLIVDRASCLGYPLEQLLPPGPRFLTFSLLLLLLLLYSIHYQALTILTCFLAGLAILLAVFCIALLPPVQRYFFLSHTLSSPHRNNLEVFLFKPSALDGDEDPKASICAEFALPLSSLSSLANSCLRS